FRHGGSDVPVLTDFGLFVAPGEKVALLGSSGSGKSTLLALIAGLAPVGDGRITIDGTPLTEETASALRTRMAWIGQQTHVFAGSVHANVALGRPETGAAEVEGALRFAALDQIAGERRVAPLGENGAGLSGGEILRLALARAAANDAAGL